MADLAIIDATHIPFGFRQEGRDAQGKNTGRWLEIGYGRLNEDGSAAMLLDRMPTGGYDCKVLLMPIGKQPPHQSRMADLASTDATHTAFGFRKEGASAGVWLECGYGRLDEDGSIAMLLNRMATGTDYKVMLLPIGAEQPLTEPEPKRPALSPVDEDNVF